MLSPAPSRTLRSSPRKSNLPIPPPNPLVSNSPEVPTWSTHKKRLSSDALGKLFECEENIPDAAGCMFYPYTWSPFHVRFILWYHLTTTLDNEAISALFNVMFGSADGNADHGDVPEMMAEYVEKIISNMVGNFWRSRKIRTTMELRDFKYPRPVYEGWSPCDHGMCCTTLAEAAHGDEVSVMRSASHQTREEAKIIMMAMTLWEGSWEEILSCPRKHKEIPVLKRDRRATSAPPGALPAPIKKSLTETDMVGDEVRPLRTSPGKSIAMSRYGQRGASEPPSAQHVPATTGRNTRSTSRRLTLPPVDEDVSDEASLLSEVDESEFVTVPNVSELLRQTEPVTRRSVVGKSFRAGSAASIAARMYASRRTMRDLRPIQIWKKEYNTTGIEEAHPSIIGSLLMRLGGPPAFWFCLDQLLQWMFICFVCRPVVRSAFANLNNLSEVVRALDDEIVWACTGQIFTGCVLTFWVLGRFRLLMWKQFEISTLPDGSKLSWTACRVYSLLTLCAAISIVCPQLFVVVSEISSKYFGGLGIHRPFEVRALGSDQLL